MGTRRSESRKQAGPFPYLRARDEETADASSAEATCPRQVRIDTARPSQPSRIRRRRADEAMPAAKDFPQATRQELLPAWRFLSQRTRARSTAAERSSARSRARGDH